MKFGLLAALELPKPWKADSELRLWRDGLEQMEVADRNGIDYLWQVEHHFLEEYSHSSAAETFLAAASQRTKRIRLGSGHHADPARRTTIRRGWRSGSRRWIWSATDAPSSAPENRLHVRGAGRVPRRPRAENVRCGRNAVASGDCG